MIINKAATKGHEVMWHQYFFNPLMQLPSFHTFIKTDPAAFNHFYAPIYFAEFARKKKVYN